MEGKTTVQCTSILCVPEAIHLHVGTMGTTCVMLCVVWLGRPTKMYPNQCRPVMVVALATHCSPFFAVTTMLVLLPPMQVLAVMFHCHIETMDVSVTLQPAAITGTLSCCW